MFKVKVKTPEGHQWRRSGVFIVNFEHISHLALVFLLLTLSRKMPAGMGETIYFKHNYTQQIIISKEKYINENESLLFNNLARKRNQNYPEHSRWSFP